MKKKIIFFLLLVIYPITGQSADFYTLDKKITTYEEITAHSKTILLLWTTWCPGCRTEINRLSKECDTAKNREDIKILYISEGEEESTVQRFFTKAKLNECMKNKILLDPSAYLARKFSIPGVPTYIFIVDGQPTYKSHFINDDLVNKIFPDE